MRKYLGLLALLFIVLSSCSNKFGKVMKSKDYEYKYKMFNYYYAQKKWSYVQQLFDDVYPSVKGTDKVQDMYYKFAYASYYLKDYLNAENLFKTYYESFPTSPLAEECEYMRAYCYYKQSPKVELDQTATVRAMNLMQSFISNHPTSPKVKEADQIITEARQKLEAKQFKNAELYYNLGYYKAAAIALSTLSDDYPDSEKADEYKMMIVRAYYKYAEMSITEKQIERYQKVIEEAGDFTERFPESEYKTEVARYRTLSTNNIKNLKNEQNKTSA